MGPISVVHGWRFAPAYPACVAALAEELGEFVASFDLEGDPKREELTRAAQMHILDTLGVGLAATTFADATPQALLALANASGVSTDSTLFGLNARSSVPMAAFVNGVSSTVVSSMRCTLSGSFIRTDRLSLPLWPSRSVTAGLGWSSPRLGSSQPKRRCGWRPRSTTTRACSRTAFTRVRSSGPSGRLRVSRSSFA